MIHHLLVTRFNLSIPQWQENNYNRDEDDELRLTKRTPLFLT